MKKAFFLVLIFSLQFTAFTQNPTPLRGVTFGVGIGYNYLTKAPKDYYLSTDGNHLLQQQELNKSSVVISSVISVKLTKIGIQTQENTSTNTRKRVLVNMNKVQQVTSNTDFKAFGVEPNKNGATPTNAKARFVDRLSINLSINLAELNNGDVSFNKAIDGGVGLGCYINEFTQIGVFYDLMRIRQMRSKVVEDYLGKPIPNGSSEYFNALDQNDNNLFYSKYFSGISIKVIFSIGNQN